MTDLIWPDDLTPYVQSFYIQPHTGRGVSPFTRAQKTYELSAPRWITRLSFRGGYDGVRGAAAFGPRLDAFIAKLRGGANRVAIYDHRRPVLRGSNQGYALTNAAALAGATAMTIDGFMPNALAFLPGDYIGGDGRSHIVDAGTDFEGRTYADDTGSASIAIWPPLKADVAAGDAIYGNPTSWFRLTDDDGGANPVQVGGLQQADLEFVEDLT